MIIRSDVTMPLLTDSTNGLSDQAIELLARLDLFRSLNANWDGADAAKPSASAIDKAGMLIRDFDLSGYCPDFVAAGSDGEIVVEVVRGERSLQVCYYADGNAEHLVFDGDECVHEVDSVP